MSHAFRLAAALFVTQAMLTLPADAQTPMQHDPAHMHQGAAPAEPHGKPPAAVPDKREIVTMPPQLKQATLREMREHLASVSDIQAALSKGDYTLAAQIADTRLGLSSTQHGDMQASARYMPAGMRELGFAMHQRASQFSVAAQDVAVTGDVRPALAALSRMTANCVACHAAYKFK